MKRALIYVRTSLDMKGEGASVDGTRVVHAVGEASVDIVIAWHLDRMTRSMVELERMIMAAEQSGVAVDRHRRY